MYRQKAVFHLARLEYKAMKNKNLAKKHYRYRYSPLALALLIAGYPTAFANQDSIQLIQQNALESETLKQPNLNPANDLIASNRTLAPHAIQLLPHDGERMGDWLSEQLHQVNEPDLDEKAVVWQSVDEAKHQESKHQKFLNKLTQLQSQPKNADIRPLVEWLKQLPVTGRVILPESDPRAMQVKPHTNPVLKDKDVVHVYPRSNMVTVLLDNGQSCRVAYHADATLQDYIQPCLDRNSSAIWLNQAYVISPEGHVKSIKIAHWNAQDAVHAQPGAWIFVPNQQHDWSDEVLQQVSEFIASQGIDLPLPNPKDEQLIVIKETKEPTRGFTPTSSDWGITGLLQTPTARMNPAGTAGINISHVQPYTHYNLLMQPFEILEVAMRYTNTDGVSYGLVSPDQDHKDKSLDVKLKLINEGRYLPAVAVGWRDPMGTSLFGGEYVVANKRYGDFDLSLGLGWGYLGARQQFSNPLSELGERFKERANIEIGQGGNFTSKAWFTGKTSLFGGVQWQSPYRPLIVKVEYDGNDYQNERFAPARGKAKSPINVGVVWQKEGLEWTAGLERGEKALLGMSLKGDLSELGQLKTSTTQQNQNNLLGKADWSKLAYRIPFDTKEKNKALQTFSKASNWQASKIEQRGSTLYIFAESDQGVFIQERLHAGLAVLDQISPPDIEKFSVVLTQNQQPIGQYQIQRNVWKTQYQQLLPPSQRIKQPIQIVDATFTAEPIQTRTPNTAEKSPATAKILASQETEQGHLSFSPSIHQSIGGPNGYLYAIFAKASGKYNLWDGAWLDGTVQARVVDNYDKYTFTAPSQLPPVRTNIREYMTNSRILMPNLQFTQYQPLGKDWHALAYAGYLESMFAGVGGEVLYRKPNSTWAIGADLNHVRQRDFKQDFGLASYKVNTGHVNFYWDMPWYDVVAKISAGQYLAGDKGATLDLSRRFDNGVTMGAWATKTDVSAEQFGEGSMDKGVYIQIPFDALFRGFASGHTSLIYQPLLRDGGAKLNRNHTLYEITAPLSKSALEIENPVKQR